MTARFSLIYLNLLKIWIMQDYYEPVANIVRE